MDWKRENGKHVSGWFEAYKCKCCGYMHHDKITVCMGCGKRDTLEDIVAREVDATNVWDMLCLRTRRYWEEKHGD